MDCIEEEVAQGDPELHEVVRMPGETREALSGVKGGLNCSNVASRAGSGKRPAQRLSGGCKRLWRVCAIPRYLRSRYGYVAFDWSSAAAIYFGRTPQAALNQGYLLANGNISSVRAVANHVSEETTQRSYLAGPARRLLTSAFSVVAGDTVDQNRLKPCTERSSGLCRSWNRRAV
jgi:hypothetical protein